MSTPGLAPAIPDDVKAARQQVQTSDLFALCYLMLCNLAYTDEDSAQQSVLQITDMLPHMPAPQSPPAAVTGKWTLGWGPVASADNSNLMYAAEFLDKASDLPIFSAVAIRGTDVKARPAGVLEQILEDLDADHQVVFPEGNAFGSKIAQGTKLGLDILNSFRDQTGRTLDQYLSDFVNANPRTPIVVTGHSLGGCQTTVVAAYLSGTLPDGTIVVPNTFAAPSAGNAAFIQWYEKTFQFCPRWYNPLDLVPMAFAGLEGIKQLWTQCGRPAPDVIKLLIDAFETVLKIVHASYSQQSAGDSRMLTSACQPATVSAIPAALQTQLVAQIQVILQNAVSKLQNDIKSLPVVGGLIPRLSFNLSAASFQQIEAWVEELLFQHSIMAGYWNAVRDSKDVAPIPNPLDAAAAAA